MTEYTRSPVPVEIVNLQDPVTYLNQPVLYAIHRSGQYLRYAPTPSTSYSSSNVNFEVLVPSNVVLDRAIMLQVPVTIDFTGTAPPGQDLLQTGYDAFRAFPLASITNNIIVELNGQSYNQENYKLIPYLAHVNGFDEATEFSMSTSPHYLDCAQSYDDLVNTIRNPLGGYGDSVDKTNTPRGAFPYDTIVNGPTSARITATLVEPLFISPLTWGDDSQKGLYGLNRFTIKIMWRTELSRIWSHSNAGGSVFTNPPVVTLGQPQLNLRYVTPQQIEVTPVTCQYDWKRMNVYVTSTNTVLAPGASLQFSLNTTQLRQVPSRVYLFARKRDADLTYLDTDTFAAIDAITVTFNNLSGILSSATSSDLYQIARRNLVSLSYESWSGRAIRNMAGGSVDTIAGVGSILPLIFGKDIPLESDLAAGVPDTFQLDATITIRNPSASAINYDFYLWVQDDGIWDIMDNTSTQSTGVVTKLAVLNARTENPTFLMQNHRALAVGGNFFGKLWDGIKSVGKFVAHEALPFALQTVVPGVGLAKQLLGRGLGEKPRHPERLSAYVEEIDSDGESVKSARSTMSGGKLMSEGRLRSRLNRI